MTAAARAAAPAGPPELEVVGRDFSFAGARAPVADAIERATRSASLDGRAALEQCDLPPEAWPALLRPCEALRDAVATGDSAKVGAALVGAVAWAAEPVADELRHAALLEAARGAAEVARLRMLPSVKARKGDAPAEARRRERMRALLAEPVAVDPLTWRIQRGKDVAPRGWAEASGWAVRDLAAAQASWDAQEAAALAGAKGLRGYGRDEHLRIAASNRGPRPTEDAERRLACRLRGGPFGRLGTVVAPPGASRLEWAALAWRLALAAGEGPQSAKPAAKSASAAEREGPVVVRVDGRTVACGTLPAESVGLLAREAEAGRGDELARLGGEATACGLDADAFVESESRKRDDGLRLPGELADLDHLARGRPVAGGVPPWLTMTEDEARDLVGALAARLMKGSAHAPELVALRARVAAERKLRGKGIAAFAPSTADWFLELGKVARDERDASADGREAALVRAFEAALPPAFALLLAPGAEISDAWGAEVLRLALAAELSALESVKRPKARAAVEALTRRAADALPGGGWSREEAQDLVECARDALRPGIRVSVTRLSSRGGGDSAAKHAMQACLDGGEGPRVLGEASVAVVGPTRWRVLTGTLAALVEAGASEIELRGGVPTARLSAPGEEHGDYLLGQALAWAARRWTADPSGEPAGAEEAVAAVMAEAAAREAEALERRRGRGRR